MTEIVFYIMAIDIGGTNIKATLLDENGGFLTEPVAHPTPSKAKPEVVLEAIAEMIAPLGAFSHISIGFPGAIRDGTILTAPNLSTNLWRGTDLATLATARFNRPARIINDATMHGLGVISGKGVELALTLGTGMGFALFRNNIPAPQIELGRHPAGTAPSYDDFVGDSALQRLGLTAWKENVSITITQCAALVNFDHLYLGGGNARHFSTTELPNNAQLVHNASGLKGGAKLWSPHMDNFFENSV